MIRRVALLGVLLVGMNLCWFVFHLLAGRTLDESAFGLFTLATSAGAVLLALGDLGLTSMLARFFSRHPLADWDWSIPLRRILPWSALVCVGGFLGLFLSYDLDLRLAALTAVAAFGLIVLRALGAGLLKAHDRPKLGVLTEKGFRLVLPLLAGLLVFLTVTRVEVWVLAWVIPIAFAVGVALLLVRRLPRGSAAVPPEFSSGGFFFWAMSATYLLATYLDRLTIPVFVDLRTLGSYGAAVNFMMAFEVLTTALGYLLVPRFGRQEDVSLSREWLLPLGLSLAGLGAMVLLGPQLLHLFFSGKYDSAADLILPLSVVGVLRVLYVVPSAVIATRFQRAELARLFVLNLGLLLTHLGLLFGLLPTIGLMGAIVANGVVAAGRLGGGGWLAHARLRVLRGERGAG